jgi:hypothetical protein
MNNQQKILSGEQTALVVELTQDYGIKAEDIIFFSDSPEPFFSYEANCYLLNQLTDCVAIELSPVPSIAGDSISTKCELTFPGGKIRSDVGVANLAETLDGEMMSEEQTRSLSKARAIRGAVRTAGIDLVKLHREKQTGVKEIAEVKSNRATLLAQAHKLGSDMGFIFKNEDGTTNKKLWRRFIYNRYSVDSCEDLNDEWLADFVAFMNTIRPIRKAAA